MCLCSRTFGSADLASTKKNNVAKHPKFVEVVGMSRGHYVDGLEQLAECEGLKSDESDIVLQESVTKLTSLANVVETVERDLIKIMKETGCPSVKGCKAKDVEGEEEVKDEPPEDTRIALHANNESATQGLSK